MTPSAAGIGVELRYSIAGEGPPLLLIAGIGGVCELPLEALSERSRVIVYQRRGYGASSAPDPYAATTVTEQSADALALLGALSAEPASLIGFGFGALIALDLALRQPSVISGAVLVDPPLYSLDIESTRELADQRAAIEAALLAGGSDAAVAALLGAGASAAQLASAQASSAASFADYAGLASLELTHRELRECNVPIRIVLSADASPALLRIAGQLDGLLGNSTLRGDGDIVAAAEALLD